ncbi:Sialic acid TRAP transporter permease protein SiaT [Aquimixticola soesokkakensis]|uniref:TRAP transporter small permease protein n=1 Tax=Aquimixticola soesokkakensis TaxID=1519096 RepID=A0A1Y5S3W1_9RHOB|nr:TRAP transporter small permease [Aquimixticola soesokkakensis]SLN29161.1 Sialic acid TRAP transporter permease protein SiaT [Aquimixticola soesokkakensis]
MKRVRRVLDALLGGVLALLLGGMVLILAWQVISRYLLGAPSTLSEETLRFGVIWMSLLGAAYATGQGSHMAVDFFRDMSPPRVNRMLHYLVPISFIVFAVFVLILGGLRGVTIASGQHSPVLRVPMGLIYASLPTSGVLIVLYSLLNIVDLKLGARRLPDELARALGAGD